MSARRLLLLALLPATLSLPARAQTPRAVVARGVAAMGGEAAVRGIRAVAVDYHQIGYAIGQEETPESPPRGNLNYGRFLNDYAGARQFTAFEIRNVAGAVNRVRRVVVGDIGMLVTNDRPAPAAPGQVVGALTDMRRSPERLLQAALDNPAALSALPARTFRGSSHDGVRYAAGLDTVNLYFERSSGTLTVLEFVSDDPIQGDRRNEIWLTRWQDAGKGVRYPRQFDVLWNGSPQGHSVLTAVTINPETPDSLFVIPDSIAQRAQRPNPVPPPLTVNLVELAPGVWRAEGGSHHSLVVDQGTRLVVVEAPQTSARIRAVLDTLRSRMPGKPVGYVVNTHHHWDHSGGVRGALAAGLSVVTHRRNADFVRGIRAARKTVAPDALSRQGAQVPALTLVDDSLALGEGERRVVIYRLPTAHVEGMLAAYLPASRLLFTSDVLTPGPTLAAAGSAEIVEFARSRGLTIEKVVGGHGGVANWADVEKAASP
jgi:glyoxylase-like metal-dependent hydrolase (beta-lactamase superfamily II)